MVTAAPDPRLPWLDIRETKLRKAKHKLAWETLFPKLMPLALKADAALAPVVERTGDANLYRVVARKE